MKRQFAWLLALVLALALPAGCLAEAAEPTRVGALQGPTAMGMVEMMRDCADDYAFTIAGSADVLTPSLVQGELDVAAVPANLAAVLYNNTSGQVKVLAINTLGVLYIVARTAWIEEHPEAVASFLEDYEKSVQFTQENVAEAAALIGEYDIFEADVAEKALPYCNITFVAGEEMQNLLSGYLAVLYEQDPASVGGTLPDEAFYYLG